MYLQETEDDRVSCDYQSNGIRCGVTNGVRLTQNDDWRCPSHDGWRDTGLERRLAAVELRLARLEGKQDG